jgi:hypothetical protein
MLRAQEQDVTLSADNPLAAMKDDLARALEAAAVPFTAEQERSIVLMMEERLRASEGLFGDLQNFSSGPTSGQQADRLKSAIEWMRQEFSTRIQVFLTDAQRTIWTRLAAAAAAATPAEGSTAAARPPAQTQFVRINNNSFTAERFFYGGGSSTEVIPRGGIGAWHGNTQYLVKDEALNARNPFASNKPPYQERQLNFDVGGPAIPGRLTTNFYANYNRSENVDTVRATMPDNSIFALGITRPFVQRSVGGQSTLQLAESHSLRADVNYQRSRNDNQNVGGFTLPERASANQGRYFQVDIRQFSVLSANSLFENRINSWADDDKTIPLSEDVKIIVLDAFGAGGAQNRAIEERRTYEFSNLYTRWGETLTIKAGMLGTYRHNHTIATNNFNGTFTFSSLDQYRAGLPISYRVSRGNPELSVGQLELGFFFQNDIKLTEQLTLLLGVRYEQQTNLDDDNNVSPRVSFAYGLGAATVLRAGAGYYYDHLGINEVVNQRRLNGTHQFELVIDNPSYPDPFQAGSVRQTFPSVRVTDPHLQAPEAFVGMIALERTFWRTFLTTVSYERQTQSHRMRLRNLNAPVDITSPVPRACVASQSADTCVKPNPDRGQIVNLESTAGGATNTFRATARHRFSIFNVNGNYTWSKQRGNTFGTSLPTDNFNLLGDVAQSPNADHQVNATVNARLPFDVFLSGSTAWHSGRYYTITTGKDDNRDSNTNDRPAGIERNSARGPRYLNFNFNLSKAVYVGGSSGGTRSNVNMFVNLTNAFNRTHYGTPSGVMTSPNFGRSTSADSPREVELGFRFQF